MGGTSLQARLTAAAAKLEDGTTDPVFLAEVAALLREAASALSPHG